ncbi:DUF4433 domain-containing protein [Vibrio vulnificus]|uniref:DarT ssDNA thymidine ADP-ribosyltransferase family protein n=1 Tax=Vibrio parahaemolyticus TaxID=670 RepID=UPI00084B8F36|nr:DarT ssDNA thymidine ADP-ribosyltransferase family protein [Vibrio parahaemolyticus]EHU4797613.1 DUF4433 domain-containing protein [Vibrio vulnificus]EGQ8512106.1 DUF4433 domain-containing protein [Vibrio parahaemolyticus]EHU4868652.1 DUF4433 domain-containing protein [Vibrio vulnificus]EHZ2652217.1 DUF4433 domain-containing protein [Vibrio vulnificus]EIA1324172.1 DUF4433 domain-containing protein [Vibrio vulnificus]
MSRKEAIKQIIEDQKIPALTHFTSLSNLESILENGLYSRDKVDESVEVNDEKRLDGRKDTISTSIGFPNSKMFYKYRNQKGGRWCVVAISKSVLTDLDCMFCKHNAADARISGLTDEELAKPESLAGMYDEIAGLPSRGDQKLRTYDATDVQAEVLIRDHIPAKYIVGIAFQDKPSRDRFEELAGKRKIVVHSRNKGLFGAREYVRR